MSSIQNYFIQKLSLIAEPKPLLLIRKCHFRTNEGMLTCFIKSLLYYSIKSCILYRVEYYESDRAWLLASDTAFILQLNLIFTIKQRLLECPLKIYLCRTILSSVMPGTHQADHQPSGSFCSSADFIFLSVFRTIGWSLVICSFWLAVQLANKCMRKA